MLFVVSENKNYFLRILFIQSFKQTQYKWQKYYNDHLPLAISIECQRNFLVPNLLEKSLMRSTMANMMQHNEDVGPLLYGIETP